MRNSQLMVVAALLLGGCGTMSNRYGVEKIQRFDSSHPNGLVVLSTGAPQPCISFASFLKLLPANEPYTATEIAMPSVDAYVLKSDFPDHHGNLHAMLVPAGRYYFAPWLANGFYKATKIPKIEFTAEAGEIVYVGEYFMPVACATSTLGRISDQMERDVALLKSRNPHIDTSRLTKRIMRFSGYAIDRE